MHKAQNYAVGCNIKGAWKSPSTPYKQERHPNIAKNEQLFTDLRDTEKTTSKMKKKRTGNGVEGGGRKAEQQPMATEYKDETKPEKLL